MLLYKIVILKGIVAEGSLGVQGQPSIQCEFQDNVSYTEKALNLNLKASQNLNKITYKGKKNPRWVWHTSAQAVTTLQQFQNVIKAVDQLSMHVLEKDVPHCHLPT